MKDDQINEAIAKSCGCTIDGEDTVWDIRDNICVLGLFTEDLNACAEFEESLDDDEARLYGVMLCQAVPLPGPGAVGYLWHADARQRCKAFLRVKGLWEEP